MEKEVIVKSHKELGEILLANKESFNKTFSSFLWKLARLRKLDATEMARINNLVFCHDIDTDFKDPIEKNGWESVENWIKQNLLK